jgi:hypothetical protein
MPVAIGFGSHRDDAGCFMRVETRLSDLGDIDRE